MRGETLRGSVIAPGEEWSAQSVWIMKLKQRVVVLCAVLLLLGLAKIFLLDGGEGSAASRRDLRAFRKVRQPVSHVQQNYINNKRAQFIYLVTYCYYLPPDGSWPFPFPGSPPHPHAPVSMGDCKPVGGP